MVSPPDPMFDIDQILQCYVTSDILNKQKVVSTGLMFPLSVPAPAP